MGLFDNPVGAVTGAAKSFVDPLDAMGRAGGFLGGMFGKKQNPYGNLQTPQLNAIQGPKQNEKVDAIRRRLDTMQGPQMLQKESAPQGPLPQFEALRQNLRDEAQSAGQQQSDALKRRFAAMGALNSGAAIKAEQQGNEAIQKQLNKELSNIGFQEAQQQFQKEEAIAGRNAQRDIYNADADFKDKVFRLESGSKLAQLDLAFDQQDLARQVAENDRIINQFNSELSTITAKKPKKGLIGSTFEDIFGADGIFG